MMRNCDAIDSMHPAAAGKKIIAQLPRRLFQIGLVLGRRPRDIAPFKQQRHAPCPAGLLHKGEIRLGLGAADPVFIVQRIQPHAAFLRDAQKQVQQHHGIHPAAHGHAHLLPAFEKPVPYNGRFYNFFYHNRFYFTLSLLP